LLGINHSHFLLKWTTMQPLKVTTKLSGIRHVPSNVPDTKCLRLLATPRLLLSCYCSCCGFPSDGTKPAQHCSL